MTSKLSVALVVQRYGEEVNGGSETLARRIAELIANEVDVTVLTTCALDYLTWANAFPEGQTEVNGVRVMRFPVLEPRDAQRFEQACIAAYASPEDEILGQAWLEAQGPIAPGLLEHLASEGEIYDAVAFVTYLYATTVQGLPHVADRSLLVPTVHDEPPLRLRIFDRVFALPRLLLFSTPEEQELARERFGIEESRSRLVGIGTDEPTPSEGGRFVAASGIERPYVLCLSRLDASKGVPDLVDAHARYRAARPDGPDLVLVGRGELDLPAYKWLHQLGFVSEDIKHDALSGATVVAVPSPYESLSLTQLEAWSHGRPTLANAASPVLVGQSRRSAGGLWYRDADEYAVMLDFLVRSRPAAEAIGRQGRDHVRTAYSWERVRERWLAALTEVGSHSGQTKVSPHHHPVDAP
jgi:glycosyltransferase involved in cell wall biosynthesis